MESKLKRREEIEAQYKWNIEDLYANRELWMADVKAAEKKIEAFGRYQGTLSKGPAQLLAALTARDEMEELLEKVYVYANQKYHEDTGNNACQQMSAKAQTVMAKEGDVVSFIEPELLAVPKETLLSFLEECPQLKLYERYIKEVLRTGEHVRSKEMEAMLAKVSEIAQGPSNTFSMFNNADLKFGSIRDEDGNLVDLTHGRYIRFLESKNPTVRQAAFETLYEKYGQFKNTLGSLMYTNVQQAVFYAKARGYDSSLAASLDGGNIPVSVYGQLIDTVKKHLPAFYDYMELRKRVLGLSELHMYDIHVPLVEEADKKVPFEEAKEIVRRGLAVLGEDYLERLDEGFEQGWIDVYENQGKRSGAYSWGAYGTHPFVLLNYNDSLNHVFTLAHEMGHAIHSAYSDQEQPYPYAGYRIFVAEVASTCNEALLIHDMIKEAGDDREKAYLINYFLDQFKSTLYRQTMFAEFEETIHHMVWEGEALNGENLSRIYYGLNQEYYGKHVISDAQIAMEWSRIPHFYTPFYVYQYATGFSAAIAISRKILDGEPGILEQYKKFLSGGSSMDPIDLLKLCGVDMTGPAPVEEALAVFEEYLEQLKKLY